MKKIKEWTKVDAAIFQNEIRPLQQPAVMRGLVSEWPVVEASRSSSDQVVKMLCNYANDKPVYTIVGQPEIGGRFFYADNLRGLNFQQVQADFSATLRQIYALRQQTNPHAVAIQAAALRETLPEFASQLDMPLLDAGVAPTLWAGNRAIVAPHYDVFENLACVVTGKRHFTLFPPEQVANLYPGPMLNAPGGVPISMVDLRAPDLSKFPRFEEAMGTAQQATLEAGDAIYIPMPWWHAVESLEDLNILINYWWRESGANALSPNHSLMHGLLSIKQMNPAQRAAWRSFFDYFVFGDDAGNAHHLPEDLHDITHSPSPEQLKMVRELLRTQLG